jgi:hypothetical protein
MLQPMNEVSPLEEAMIGDSVSSIRSFLDEVTAKGQPATTIA